MLSIHTKPRQSQQTRRRACDRLQNKVLNIGQRLQQRSTAYAGDVLLLDVENASPVDLYEASILSDQAAARGSTLCSGLRVASLLSSFLSGLPLTLY